MFDKLKGLFCFCMVWLSLMTLGPVFFLIATVFFRRRGPVFSFFARLWARACLLGGVVSIEAENEEVIKAEEPRVIVMNHESAFDIICMSVIMPKQTLIVVKKEFRYIFPMNLVIWGAGFMMIDRENRRKAVESIKGVSKSLNDKKQSFFVFPEGTRTRDGRIQRFKKGAFHIARNGQLPVYPLVIDGAREVLSRGRMIPAPGKITLKFLDPVFPAEWSGSELAERIEELRQRMQSAKDEMQQGR